MTYLRRGHMRIERRGLDLPVSHQGIPLEPAVTRRDRDRMGERVAVLAQVAAEAPDLFGSALAAGDFDSDGFADLAAGAPFEAVGSAEGAGAVSVLYGSAGGLTRTGGSCSPRSAGRSRAPTCSASRWRAATSTTTASTTC